MFSIIFFIQMVYIDDNIILSCIQFCQFTKLMEQEQLDCHSESVNFLHLGAGMEVEDPILGKSFSLQRTALALYWSTTWHHNLEFYNWTRD